MSIRGFFTYWSRGDRMGGLWRLYSLRSRARHRLTRDLWTLLLNRSARRHGGYLGPEAVIQGRPVLPHGLHGVYISRYATIGPGCRIYQNVTIGEVGGKAPFIGPKGLIGAGEVFVGGRRVRAGAKVGAGAVVCQDIPEGCTVVAGPPRILKRGDGHV